MNKIFEVELKYVVDGQVLDSDAKKILALVSKFGYAIEIFTKKKYKVLTDIEGAKNGVYVASEGKLIANRIGEKIDIDSNGLDIFKTKYEEYQENPKAYAKSISLIPAKELIKTIKR